MQIARIEKLPEEIRDGRTLAQQYRIYYKETKKRVSDNSDVEVIHNFSDVTIGELDLKISRLQSELTKLQTIKTQAEAL